MLASLEPIEKPEPKQRSKNGHRNNFHTHTEICGGWTAWLRAPDGGIAQAHTHNRGIGDNTEEMCGE